jgi:hypothetical protein
MSGQYQKVFLVLLSCSSICSIKRKRRGRHAIKRKRGGRGTGEGNREEEDRVIRA